MHSQKMTAPFWVAQRGVSIGDTKTGSTFCRYKLFFTEFEYLGCYDDNPQWQSNIFYLNIIWFLHKDVVFLRLYSEYKWYPDFNTVNSCAHKCLATSDSHIYIAIEDGGKCECGDSSPSSMKYEWTGTIYTVWPEKSATWNTCPCSWGSRTCY